VTSIVGTGLKYQARIDRNYLGLSDEDADKWENNAEREFSLWADSIECDIERTQNFYALQDLALRATLESGDVFVLTPSIERAGSDYNLKIQLVEADRVLNQGADTQKLSGGIERDANGAPEFCHIAKVHPGNMVSGGVIDCEKVRFFGEKTGRRNVLHIYKKLRPGQTRGIPDLAPVIEAIKQITRLSEAEVDAAVVSSFFTVFIKSETGGTGLAPMIDAGGKADDVDMKLGKAAILSLANDESIEIANPGRPNPEIPAFLSAFYQDIGVALELPHEILTKSFKSSYSAAQAALLEAWRTFMTRRAWLSSSLCDPVLELVLMEAVLKGKIYAPGFVEDLSIRKAYLGAAWVGPSRGHIDEVKSIKAAKQRIDEELTTRSDEAAAIGGNWEKNHRQRMKEEAARRADNTNPDADGFTLGNAE
jgi:lambda family phage portal protein